MLHEVPIDAGVTPLTQDEHFVTGPDGLSLAGGGETLIMLTAILVLLAATLVVLAGEAVRGQCRRMLSRPVAMPLGERMTSKATVAA